MVFGARNFARHPLTFSTPRTSSDANVAGVSRELRESRGVFGVDVAVRAVEPRRRDAVRRLGFPVDVAVREPAGLEASLADLREHANERVVRAAHDDA